ncbi:glycosyltransferase family 39 protein [Candidatus Sumerlaeota bacterium]|nr:glycosyltransferase family 39 protein [Candidatus Sumerlaeota bacterium]
MNYSNAAEKDIGARTDRMGALTARRAVICGLIATAGAMRLVGLGTKSLWVDEVHSTFVAETLDQILEYCLGGHTPPLRYILVWALQQSRYPEFAIRLPAAVFGALSIPLMLWLGEMLGHRRAGIVAAILLLLSPWHLLHSQDARYYAVILFFALAALGLAIRIVQDPQPVWRWIVLAVVCALSLYISYVAVLSVGAVVGYLLVCLVLGSARQLTRTDTDRRTRTRMMLARVGLAALVGILILSPWCVLLLIARYTGNAPTPSPEAAASARPATTILQPPIQWGTPFNRAYADDFLAKLGLEQPAAAKWLLLALFALGLVKSVRRDPSLAILAVLWFVMPWALILNSASLSQFCPPRYMIHYLGLYVLMAAIGAVAAWDLASRLLARLSPSGLRKAIAFGIVTVIVAALTAYGREDLRYFRSEKQDWKSAAAFLDQNVGNSDAVLAGGFWTPLGLIYYGSRLTKPINLVPGSVTAERIEREIAIYARVWYVTWGPIPADVARLLLRSFEKAREFPGLNGNILIYRSKPKAKADDGG